ncbi:hypothetical protein Godav_006736 [Gossypium davidsonii]|uniref:Uncharacterized protein n=2 Tax=Gossypium TaxID=3633 RepID=A0A7J8S557_GOSDV|nr:hypothetical protein [Gossypium davidsonii]MBA0656538.1 hypothetical protein [Gossypium klotzschianum]
MSVNDFSFDDEMEVTDFVRSNSHFSKNMDSIQDSVFYLDRSVMECNLPELVVCYKESTYHVVKDICIDDGVLTKDKFLFDSGANEKFLPSKTDLEAQLVKENLKAHPEGNQSGKDIDDECGTKKKLDADTCIQDVSLLEESESNKGIPYQCDSKDLILSREMKEDAVKMITEDVSKELYTLGLGELLLMSEMSTVKAEIVCSDCRSDGTQQQNFQNSSEKEATVMPALVSPVEESNNGNEEAILSAPALVSAAEESEHGKWEATLISPVLASASEESTSRRIVDEVSDSSARTSSKDRCCHNLDLEPLASGSTPKLEDPADQLLSSNLQLGYGECSFSAAGLITYSGPIAYSGSLSHRSDSSTTSTRSFAFPILQSEWNSSPVRMAKAERRHYRKHRGWRQGLLCCRF